MSIFVKKNPKQHVLHSLHSYCFRLQLSDDSGNATVTCFSNEADSMIKDCKELVQATDNRDPYDYPEELLALEGKKRVFQIHFDPDCTKEKPHFILDTSWEYTTS